MDFLKSAFSFDGRVRRITFWVNLLVLLPISFFLNQRYVHKYTSFYDLQDHSYITNKPIYLIAMAVIGLRVLSISVRRWHDLDKSGWLAALNLFVVANNAELIDLPDSLYWITLFLSAGISLVILGFQGFVPGDEGSNQYGPAPQEGQIF